VGKKDKEKRIKVKEEEEKARIKKHRRSQLNLVVVDNK